ncbi:MAG TPA: hypothetical protein VKG45_15540 [Actinomycetes bacterium]|nr:hypothetical protein [Actinomycetes bacterium]
MAAVRSAGLALLATAVMLAAADLAPAWRSRVVAAWLLLLGALGLRLLAGAVRAGLPPPRPSEVAAALARPGRAPRPPEAIVALGRRITLAGASDRLWHTGLRPVLIRIAADRLAWWHGVALDAEPRAARAALGERAWALLRPDRRPAGDQRERGPDLATLEALVADLERLGPDREAAP